MECKEAINCCPRWVQFSLMLVLFFVPGLLPAMAQTSFESSATHRQDLKYSLQEAREVESVYSDTHLNLRNRNFKRGEAPHKQIKRKGDRNFRKNARSSNPFLQGTRNALISKKTKSKP